MQSVKNVLMDSFIYMMKMLRVSRAKLGLLSVTDDQYGMFDYKGVRSSSTIHSTELYEYAEQYDEFRDDDVVLLTYPKAGTHFLADVINSIYLEKGLRTTEPDHVSGGYCPLELGISVKLTQATLKNASSPRTIGTHAPWNLLPPKVKDYKVKVIHCMRNPKDAACSAYPFLKRVGVFVDGAAWDDFLKYFISGKVVCGDFFDFLHQWYPHRNSPNNMYLYYEDMIHDLGRETRRIADFLGLQLTDEQVERIVEKNTFSNLKKKVGNTVIHRQGKSGTWTSKFTVEQNRAADEWIEKGMRGLDDLKFCYD